jgi:hypothetical protein
MSRTTSTHERNKYWSSSTSTCWLRTTWILWIPSPQIVSTGIGRKWYSGKLFSSNECNPHLTCIHGLTSHPILKLDWRWYIEPLFNGGSDSEVWRCVVNFLWDPCTSTVGILDRGHGDGWKSDWLRCWGQYCKSLVNICVEPDVNSSCDPMRSQWTYISLVSKAALDYFEQVSRVTRPFVITNV